MAIDNYYLAIVVLLFFLSVTDLVVGVSNDAVNFLNSSIGSKVATRKVIVIVAGLGILSGALFSSGMMEIARKGIFVPEYFSFHDVMIIFLAVMLTDILLLDLFNTFGMPTSTTVSIVFELLGASVVVASLKLYAQGSTLENLFMYINTSKALAIIGGIFISVLVAFTLGAIIQYLVRIAFSFKLHQSNAWLRVLFFAICFSSIAYFLVYKGLSGASFISADQLAKIESKGLQLMVWAFALWLGVGFFLQRWGVNLFRVIVFFGTFALAMSFAGNDLVNFIGVAVAGWESFQIWTASGVSAVDLKMVALAEPVQTNTGILLTAGLIMVLTLWFSKKAQSVTDTEVKLGRQDEGEERFKPGRISRMLVDAFKAGNKFVANSLHPKLLTKLNARFEPLERIERKEDIPAFDLVRASVNLTLASLLISLATSMKLPLSTTYVSFMVAMGASLADRAWSSNSAAHRISGVLSVIGGWFLTALIAFTSAGLFALLIFWGGGYAILGLTGVVFFAIYRTFSVHRKRSQKKV